MGRATCALILLLPLLAEQALAGGASLKAPGGGVAQGRAERLAKLSLDCIDQEYPNKTGDIYESPRSLRAPRQMHPVFFGCYDWHSSVHGHWALARVLRLFPGSAMHEEIAGRLDAHLRPEWVARE